MSKKIIVIGAGNIGRGVVGLLYSRAGYQLCFYDLAHDKLLEMKEQGYYTVGESRDSLPLATTINRHFRLINITNTGYLKALIPTF